MGNCLRSLWPSSSRRALRRAEAIAEAMKVLDWREKKGMIDLEAAIEQIDLRRREAKQLVLARKHKGTKVVDFLEYRKLAKCKHQIDELTKKKQAAEALLLKNDKDRQVIERATMQLDEIVFVDDMEKWMKVLLGPDPKKTQAAADRQLFRKAEAIRNARDASSSSYSDPTLTAGEEALAEALSEQSAQTDMARDFEALARGFLDDEPEDGEPEPALSGETYATLPPTRTGSPIEIDLRDESEKQSLLEL